MRLPPALISFRSSFAQFLGGILGVVEPLHLRLRRFAFEVWARSQLKGRIAPGVQFVGLVASEGTGNVHIGRGTRVGRRVFFETYGDARIEIGEDVTLNDGITIVAYANVTIASHAMIGELTSIRDSNHGMLKKEFVHNQPHTAAAIYIGSDAWIGRGVLIGEGVQIHHGAVVGANSVVTREVPSYTIVVGAPARPIGQRV
jgi:acetyltransferase-like isoleucine patch superfamily enzyme